MKIENMFFEYIFARIDDDKAINLSSEALIETEFDGYIKSFAEELVKSRKPEGEAKKIIIKKGIPALVKEAAGSLYKDNDEAYALEINEDINLYGATERAIVYALVTLRQLIRAKQLKKGILFDYPDKAIRGYRVYIPGATQKEDFKDLVEFIINYKYNTLIIEVGGAMEYERRPKINEQWIEFCKEVNSSPYEAQRIQHETYPWEKNSIHVANCQGSFMPKKELKELVQFCKDRYLNVIPEVPSMSHSDYLVMAYPEINERVEDKYPDTYCPSNPKTYEILFDVLEEVIEVFEPNQIHIGHDELYTAAKCERCRDKNPVDLYVGDIIKINNFLKERNIKTSMWCEKCYNGVYQGRPCGGAAKPEKDIPELYPCAGRIPKDILLVDWYWPILDKSFAYNLQDMGYEMIYGNYDSMRMTEYRERMDRVKGAIISNWGPFNPEYMQRNYQFYALVYTGYTLWSTTFDNDQENELTDTAVNETFDKYLSDIGDNYISVIHTTDYHKETDLKFTDGKRILMEDWLIGNYEVEFEDGTKEVFPVIYGNKIAHSGIAKKTGAFNRILYMTLPIIKDGKTYYKTAYKVNSTAAVKEFRYVPVNTEAEIIIEYFGRE